MAKDIEVSDEVDASGRLKQRVEINGLKPTLRFAPEELPSNPAARAAFPKELVDENLAVTPYEGAGSFPKDKLLELEAELKDVVVKVEAEVEAEVKKEESKVEDVLHKVEPAEKKEEKVEE